MTIQDRIKFAHAHPDCIKTCALTYNSKAIPHLVKTDIWPNAASDNLIVRDEQNQKREIRSKTLIRSFITEGLKGKKFLDFGAGNDVTARAAIEAGASVSVAYDKVPSKGVTTNWEEVVEKGPYDVILLFDVVDHLTHPDGSILNPNPDQISAVLKEVAKVLKKDGTAYVRCHPWTSRHGTHCYMSNNKAFSHYISDTYDAIPTIKITTPVGTYKNSFTRAGFKIQQQKTIENPLEKFFNSEAFKSFSRHYSKANVWMFRKIMTFTFIDYKLKK